MNMHICTYKSVYALPDTGALFEIQFIAGIWKRKTKIENPWLFNESSIQFKQILI